MIHEKSIDEKKTKIWPLHGWIGILLIIIFWIFNWALSGLRTHWGFFPLWVGYALTVDAMAFYRKGSSLLTRHWKKYILLFAISAPAWWVFELVNERVQYWHYTAIEAFTDLEYFSLTTLSFTTVIPAVFGTAEWIGSFAWIQRMQNGPKIKTDKVTTVSFFMLGWIMLALLLIWPEYSPAFIWMWLYFVIDPINVWLGFPSLLAYTAARDWRPVIALWVASLICGFFWEMWNMYAYPKWIYTVPYIDFWHVFEMPLLGYLGYLPFSLELFAMYHLVMGLFKAERNYLQILPDNLSHS